MSQAATGGVLWKKGVLKVAWSVQFLKKTFQNNEKFGYSFIETSIIYNMYLPT